jgi:hypothetical protein
MPGICGQDVDGMCVAMYESNQRSNYYKQILIVLG